jgi:transposase-like protein
MVRANKSVKRSRFTLKKKRNWSVREKLMVLHFLNGSNSVRATARHFDLQPNQVRDWRNKKDQLKASAPHLLKLHSGRQASFLELENELANWILECREQGLPITRNMATKKAKELAQTDKYQEKYPNISSFKFSNKWMDCFMNRYDLSNRRRTTVSQHLPEDLLEKQQSFLSFVLYRRIQYDYPLQFIGNMDETPVAFDLPNSYTLEKRGSNTINIKTTGHERSTFTVVLGCMADGSKLPPVVIFKLKNIPRETFPNGIFVRVNAKGWVNEDEMIWWVENVWSRRTVDSSNPSSLLVLDSFRGHLVSSVKQKLHEKATNMAVIPGGLTSKLQPLDVSINKSFKSNVSIIN